MYQWDARDYRMSSSEQQKWARELIPKLRLTGNERILDIGSGDGKISAEIALRVPEGSVLGIDSSEEMVRLALETFRRADHPNLSFQIGDARSLSFEGEFDCVFSNATLHWVIDHTPVVQGIFRSLKTPGRILLQMGGRGNASGVVEVMDRMIRTDAWSPFFQNFSFPYGFHGPEQYRSWLKEAGFREKRVELLTKDMVHQGEAGFAAWIRTTWLPYTQRVPEDRRQSFIEELVRRYLEIHPVRKDGKVHVFMVRLEVEAFKG